MFARGNLSERFKIYIFFQANCSEALHLFYESLKEAYCFLFQFEFLNLTSRKISYVQKQSQDSRNEKFVYVLWPSWMIANDIPAVHVTPKKLARSWQKFKNTAFSLISIKCCKKEGRKLVVDALCVTVLSVLSWLTWPLRWLITIILYRVECTFRSYPMLWNVHKTLKKCILRYDSNASTF